MSIFKRQDPTKLQQQVAGLKGSGGFQKDEKEWRLTTDAQKNGSAVIRFLPARSDDELAFVRLVSHSFQKNGKWFIENCPSTHGKFDECPLCKQISEEDLFERAKVKGSEADKLYSLISRKNNYWANILVVKDPAKPENEGQVFKYRFGKSIMDKITIALKGNPELDVEPLAVTCPFGGANFTLQCKKKSGFANYDDSSFGNPKEIANINDEATQKHIFEGMSDLRPIVAADQFKTTEELQKKYSQIMGTAAATGAAASAGANLDEELSEFDKELNNFDNGASGAKESGGINQLSTGAGDLLDQQDDEPPFDTSEADSKATKQPSTPAPSDDEDLDALLNDL